MSGWLVVTKEVCIQQKLLGTARVVSDWMFYPYFDFLNAESLPNYYESINALPLILHS